MSHVHKICRGVYVGSVAALLDVVVMSKIGSVLTLIEFGRFKEEVFPLCYGEREYIRIALHDHDVQVLEQTIDEMCKFIDQQRDNNVLVHCVEGHSRSVIVVASYLIWRYPDRFQSVESVTEYILKRHPQAKFNQDFLNFLQRYFFSTSSTEDS
jgi:protein-tyrosine phosphatase